MELKNALEQLKLTDENGAEVGTVWDLTKALIEFYQKNQLLRPHQSIQPVIQTIETSLQGWPY